MPARMAVVCALCAVTAPAFAEDRRKVAVIDLSGDEAAKSLRQAIYDELQIHWALRSLGNATLDAALEGALVDEDQPHVDAARQALAAADEALVQFESRKAEQQVAAGWSQLLLVTPTPSVIALYAELAFTLGRAELELHKRTDAGLAFALVHRLDPMRSPDPARYVPELVTAYKAATVLVEPKFRLAIAGQGRVWVDGSDRGAAPVTVDVEAGHHLIQMVGPERESRGMAIDVAASDSLVFDDAPATEQMKVQRARRALAQAPDPAARAGAMNQLAALLVVHDAVLISKDGGKLSVQTWREGCSADACGFSRPIDPGQAKPIDLLAPLAPAKPPEPEHVAEPQPQPPFHPPPIVVDKPWYERRWVQASTVTGVAAAIVGAIVWARRDQNLTIDTRIQPR